MNIPKISVVIPVYNTEEYLEQCLDSVLQQTLTEIEVLCVDDSSRDSSRDILSRYADQDARVKVFFFDEPKSALQARKKGVMEAAGEYIMFLDADDYLEMNACERLYEKIRQEDVDILHFSSRVVNCANLPEKRIANNQKLLAPCEEKIQGKSIFNACFLKKKFFITLWNKVFRAELCKNAFSHMEDRYLPKAQDLYSFFIIAYFARSYMGWSTEPFHNYCIGRGVVGSSNLNLDKFERYCTQKNIVDALTVFSKNQDIMDKTAPVIDRYYEQWIQECLKLWKNELPKEDGVQGWEILCRYWGARAVISYAAKLYWYSRTEVAEKLKKLPKTTRKDRQVKTIGIYYYHFTIGGVQRVISLLSAMFYKMGYKVVIITDSQETENDFPRPEGVDRVSICSRDSINQHTFEQRLDSWQELIDKYHFDLIFYHAWTSNIMLWDFLYFKNVGIPVVAQAHSVFSYTVNKFMPLFIDVVRILPVADALVVLSEADRVFWSAYLNSVYMIPNPVSKELESAKPAFWSSKALIWVGRVSNEKRPEAVFTIMQEVVKQIPDAKLYLLGNFDDPKWVKMAADKKIQENVVFCGMVQDVHSYYEKASIQISTSVYEGFPMTILEAQAHGIPTVMFDMPYLTLGKKACGTIGVPMMDCAAAAAEIVKLLCNSELWDDYSLRAINSYRALSCYDFESAWERVITGETADSGISEATADMIHTFVNHYEQGLKYLKQHPKGTEYDPDVYNSLSFKIGLAITFIPRKIRGFFWCTRENGLKYTVKYAFEKLGKFFRRSAS